MTPLPLDVIVCISAYLNGSKSTQAKLALLNSDLYRVIIPLLYHEVKLRSARVIISFCNAIAANARLGPSVRSLSIHSRIPAMPNTLPDISSELAVALPMLENLDNLSLTYPLNPLSKFEENRFARVGPNLRRLVILPYPRSDLYYFLLCHEGITYLEFPELPILGAEPSFFSATIHRDMVPELSEIIGPATRIAGFLADRPIQKVDVLFDIPLTELVPLVALKSGLAKSSRPVTEICIRQGIMKSYGLWMIIQFDGQALSLTLRRVTFLLSAPINYQIWPHHLRELRSFQVLEHLTLGYESNDQPKPDFERLGQLVHLDVWRSHCSSLITVDLFGRLLT